MSLEITNVNYLAILIATIIYFIIGALWYSIFFGKAWMRAMNLKKVDIEREKNKGSIWKSYIANFLANFVMVYILAVFVKFSGATTILSGMYVALLIWLGFISTITLSSIIWEGKSLEIYLINNAYHLVSLNVAAILVIVI